MVGDNFGLGGGSGLQGKGAGFIDGEGGRTFNNLGEGIFRLVGCPGVLVPVGIKVRAETQPNP